MRYGFVLPGGTAIEQLEQAVLADQAGWDGVFVWDHLWNRTYAPFADPFVTLAAIAVATERVVIGTMVVALPRRRPQLVAQATTSLDRKSAENLTIPPATGFATGEPGDVMWRASIPASLPPIT